MDVCFEDRAYLQRFKADFQLTEAGNQHLIIFVFSIYNGSMKGTYKLLASRVSKE